MADEDKHQIQDWFEDNSVPGTDTVYFFFGEEDPHRHNVLQFIQSLSKRYPNGDFRILETWHNENNQALSRSLHQNLGLPDPGIHEVIIGNVSLMRDQDIPSRVKEGVNT